MRMPPLAPVSSIAPAADAGVALPTWRAGSLRASREAIDDAHAVLAFLRTGMRARVVDPAQTLWIIDLAPGDGERAWRVLRELAATAPRGPAIRYLAGCRGDTHRACLAGHPKLAPLIVEGLLSLDRDDRGLPMHPVRNPPVVLAHDAFSSGMEAVYACRHGEWMEWDAGASDWSRVRRADGMQRLLPCSRSVPDDAVLRVPREAMALMSDVLRASDGRMLLRGADTAFDSGVLARWHRAQGASVHQSRHGSRGRILHLALHEGGDGALRDCLPELVSLPHPDEHVDFLRALDALAMLPCADWPPLMRASGSDPRALRIAMRGQGMRGEATDPAFLEAALACMDNAFDPDEAQRALPDETQPVETGHHRP